MMHYFNTLGANSGFMMNAYNTQMLAWFIPLLIVGIALKGWALWRSARMNKQWWFIAMLIINSAGILPVIFLLITNEEYKKWLSSNGEAKQ